MKEFFANEEVGKLLHTSGAYIIDPFETLLPGLEMALGSHPLYTVGKKRSTASNNSFEKGIKLPDFLRPHKERLFGLTINQARLAGIRNERRPNSRYCSARQCQYEVQMVEQIYRHDQINYIDTTEFSVKEIAKRIMDKAKLERRLKYSINTPR